MRETSVVLGIVDRGLQEEVLHFLDRLPGVKVVGASEGKESLRRLVRDRGPDVVVGVPEHLAGLEPAATMAVALRETTEGLRTAIRVGARGFYVWPEERDALARDVARVDPVDTAESIEEGTVVAVLGARGGAGTTFLATNLAAAFARGGARTALADLDPLYGDVAPALGIPPEAAHPSVTELATVSRELTTEHLDRVMHPHPSGFRVLLAPPQPPREPRLDPGTVGGVVVALRSRFAAVVLHLPRLVDEAVRAAVELADEVLVVVTLDVLGIRAAKRLLDHLRSFGLGRSLRLVVNKAGRGELVPEDAELVLEAPLACVIGAERRVPRAQNRGELLVGRRGRLSRRISRLAGRLLDRSAA
ncbi:MAG: AAA family ATPase [Actinomycetota bacterium]